MTPRRCVVSAPPHPLSPSRDTVQQVWGSMWTLFLPRHQLELVGLLQQVTAACHRTLAQVSNTYVCTYIRLPLS